MSLARVLGKKTGRQSYMSDSRWVLPTSFIGFEAEYEGVVDRTLPKHTFADFWAYHEEGSLKDRGAEYAFSNPLFGVDAYNAIEWLISHAQSSKWKCTKRTGIHVHMDVRDLTVPQFSGMSMIYGALEPILYRWVGDGRASSHFCIPLYRADEALLGACTIIKAAHSDDKQDGGNSALNAAEVFQRYAGYNLQALHKFGSVEFRHLQTTHDLNRIITWINMLMSLKAAAYKLPQSDGAVVRMLETMAVEEFLGYVFPPEIAESLHTKQSEEEFRFIGLPSARDIAVHGCGNTNWVASSFPKGEHEGFTKWFKSSGDTSDLTLKKSEYDEIELVEPDFEADAVDEEEREPEPPPLRMAPIDPEAQARIDRWAAGINPWNIIDDVGLRVLDEPPNVPAQAAAPPQAEGAAARERERLVREREAINRLRAAEQRVRNRVGVQRVLPVNPNIPRNRNR